MYKFSYDMFEHIEVPTCILSNVYHHHIGVINNIDPSTLKVNFNMNSQQEFSFDVQKIVDGVECDVWDKLTSLRYVFVPEHNEYYKADVTIDESNDTVKHLTLSSASEYELSNKIIRNLEINTESDILRNKYDTTVPTYAPNVLYNPSDPSNSILHRALADKAPDWSIIHVDESIRNIQRTFSVSNQKIYDFFTKTIAEEYSCLFAFNSVDRTIAVYDLLNVCNHCGKRGEFLNYCPTCGSNHITYGYGKNTNIFINYNNFSEKITLDGNEDSVKNCFYVTGGDEKINAAVRNCNPNGSSYIYRFSDADYADMPDELVEGLEEYNEKYQDALKIYQPIVQNWYEAVNDYYYYKTSMMPRVNGEHWEANKGYDVGDEAYVKTLPSWAYMECVKAGVTGDKEFDASHVTDGEVINDGTVKWKIHKHIISIPSAEQTLEEIRTALSNETIYFLDEIPASITLINNEISNMASLNINNLFRIEIITNDGKNKVVGKKWYGNMKVYNTGDDTDKYTSIIPLVANLAVVESIQEYTNYMTAKVEKRLNKNDTTFTSIFKLPDNEFKEQIKQYSLDSLVSFVKSYQACLDVLIANGIKDPSSSYMGWKTYTPIYQPYYQRISWLNDEVTVRQATVDEAEKRRNDYREQMLNIQNSLNLEENLGTELYKTLFNYLREDSFQNSNYVSTGLSDGEQINYAKQLLEIANDELEKACELQVTLSDTVKNLFNTEEFKDYKDRINLGDYIICEVDNVLYRLRLISISYSYSNPESIDLTFSNFTKISNFLSDAQSIINSAQSISLSYSSVMHQVDKATTITDNVNEIMTNGMSSNDTKIINNGNSEVVFDENGILAREYDDVRHEYSPKQMKITHNNLQFTNNNWETTILTVGEQDYEKYDPASKTWITTRDYGVTANFVDSGYIHGTEIVAGDIYSEGYREGDTEGVGGYGSHINLKDGSFDFAGGALLGWWNEETQSYEVRIKSDVEIGGDIIAGARIGSWTVYSDGLHCNTAKITPNGVNVEGDVRAQDYYMNNVSLSSILADKQDKIIAGENITIDDDGRTINAIVPAGGAGIYAGLEMPSTNIGEDKNLYLQYDGTNTESSYVRIASIPMGGGEYQKTVTVDLTPDYYHLRFASTIGIANSITVLKQNVYPDGSVTLHYGNNDVFFTINGNSISVRKTEYNGNTYDIYASVIQEYTPTKINTVYGKLNNIWFPFPSGEGGGVSYGTTLPVGGSDGDLYALIEDVYVSEFVVSQGSQSNIVISNLERNGEVYNAIASGRANAGNDDGVIQLNGLIEGNEYTISCDFQFDDSTTYIGGHTNTFQVWVHNDVSDWGQNSVVLVSDHNQRHYELTFTAVSDTAKVAWCMNDCTDGAVMKAYIRNIKLDGKVSEGYLYSEKVKNFFVNKEGTWRPYDAITYGSSEPKDGLDSDVYFQIGNLEQVNLSFYSQYTLSETDYSVDENGINITVSGTTRNDQEYVAYKLTGLEVGAEYDISFDAKKTNGYGYYGSDYRYGMLFNKSFDYGAETVELFIPFERDTSAINHSYTATYTATDTEAYMWLQTGAINDGSNIVINITKLNINNTGKRITKIWQNVDGDWVCLSGGEEYEAGENIIINDNIISATNTDEIAELEDVALSNVANGQVLKYNSTTQKWENANETGGGGLQYFVETEDTLYGVDGSNTYMRDDPKFRHTAPAVFTSYLQPNSTRGGYAVHTCPNVDYNDIVGIRGSWFVPLFGKVGGDGIFIISKDPTHCYFTIEEWDGKTYPQTGAPDYSDSYSYSTTHNVKTQLDVRQASHSGAISDTFTFNGETYYIVIDGQNWNWWTIATEIETEYKWFYFDEGEYPSVNGYYQTVGEYGLKVMQAYNASTRYNGMSRDNGLAFFAGASDANGTNALIKIYENGDADGLATTADLTFKQDKLVAGNNISIGSDGKTLSATNTDEVSELTDVAINNLTNGQVLKYNTTSGKWENSKAGYVVANPSGTASGDITKIQIDEVIYNIPQTSGGGDGDVLPNPVGMPTETLETIGFTEIHKDYYLTNGLVGKSGSSYVYCNLDKNLVEDIMYKVELRDNGTTYTSSFTWRGTNLSLDISGKTLSVQVDRTGLTYYSGSFRNIYCDIYTETTDMTIYDISGNEYEAGENISIVDNVISATYSVFDGSDGTTAGSSGLVPAPTATDNNKYLKGDGTWSEIQTGDANMVELTMAQYQALTPAQKMDEHTLYLIKDSGGISEYYMLTEAEYNALPDTKLTDCIIRFISDQGVIMLNGITFGSGGGNDTRNNIAGVSSTGIYDNIYDIGGSVSMGTDLYATLQPVEYDIYSASYLSSGNTVIRNRTEASYLGYKQIEIDLADYLNKSITITNTGDRNYYGFTSSKPEDRMALSAARQSTSGSLSYTYTGGADRYLIYDFTSSDEADNVISVVYNDYTEEA